MSHLIVDSLHIVLLHTSIIFALETGVAPHAGIDLAIVNRDNLYMVLLRGTFDECLHQQIRIAALPGAS